VTRHVVTESGRSIGVAPGDEVELDLPENASTAYLWHVTDEPAGLRLLANEPRPPDDLAPGRGGRRILRFAVDSTVDGTLRAELRRPWEPTSEPDAAFELRLTPAAPDHQR
jgi:predicted secreted protein